ncbi:ADP-ribosylglycohydrolase [Enterobacter sp. kpr-6]|uniref:ADP-ribosylglycohydrolase family protein n=1 Tax=Enterobacter sp. kpr-6 TaxID=1761782 RepID=UPI0008EC14BD|nr:ADP-ribosylglycohydrolase family protein [Enterobacter sp. kpr-6]SFR02296.1 ADP-ribosylglycohydrolase [Enterobacter sp. kpr-6]
MELPADYYSRVYAGVLGKLIGVYLGRPFEGWTYQKIMQELGPIQYYVHERFNRPLVTTDDDVAGTFTFIRALEDYGLPPDLTDEQLGHCWLNYIIDKRTILWWGGNGNSTEHTAWLNLKKGIPAPLSGAIATNGKTIAEQIGAQIFIDSWALVAPGQPELAASLTKKAASVSHDGESVYAAMLWAAMESQAFICQDIETLIETGLSVIPADSQIAGLIADIRRWWREDNDWQTTRQKIETHYGYHKYPSNCHVIPNHALMIMAMLYAPDNFQQAQCIVNTSGWDTDCNAGNVGCLSGIMLGLEGIDAGPDWRGPLADRMLISSADGGFSINNAVRITDYLVDLGHQIAGLPRPEPKKAGAQYHFSLPGSVQGFRWLNEERAVPVDVGNEAYQGRQMLSLRYHHLAPGLHASVTTQTFTPPEIVDMPSYELMASPPIYPGQRLQATLIAPPDNIAPLRVQLCYRIYDENNDLTPHVGEAKTLAPGENATLLLDIPDHGGQPIGEVGIRLSTDAPAARGRLLLDAMRWDGTPTLTLKKPRDEDNFWWRAWVNGVDIFSRHYPGRFRIANEYDEGLLIYGTREWNNYRVRSDLTLHLGDYGGLAFRVQGMRRYYAARILRDGTLQLVRVRDAVTRVLAERQLSDVFERPVTFDVIVNGRSITATVDGQTLCVEDAERDAFTGGGIGLLINAGALSTDAIHIGNCL